MQDFLWWSPPKESRAEEIRAKALARAKALYENLSGFRSDAFRYYLIVDYKSYDSTKTKGNSWQNDEQGENYLLDNPYLTLNVTSSVIETAATKVAKSKPKVTFLTKNADREKQHIAKKLDNFVLKIFKKSKAWKCGSKAFKSACVTGLGVVKIASDKYKKIKLSNIPIFDFYCDNSHSGANTPTEAGESKVFTFEDLKMMFPSKIKELNESYHTEKSIRVWELYKQYKYHMIFTEKVTLLSEKWDKPCPYLLIKWEEADQGVFSVGLAKKLHGIQTFITYIMGKTATSVRNFAIPRVFISKGAETEVKSMTNLVGELIEIAQDEQPPHFSTPPAMNDQVLQILNMLWTRAYEVVGISSLSAGGVIPRGLDKASGAALRTYQQVEGERFQLIRSNYEDEFIKLAKMILKMISDKDLPKGITRQDIKNCKDDLSIWTSSLLPETPAGKLATVGEFFNTGLVTGDQALALMQSPDVDKFLSSATSRLKAIDLLLDRAIERKEKPIYYPALGLEVYLDRARKMFAELIIEDENSDKIPILEACIKELTAKIGKQSGIANTINNIQGGQGQVPVTTPTPGAGQGL